MTVSNQKKDIWEKLNENDCRDFFKADPKHNFFTRTYYCIHKKHDKWTRDFSKKNLGAQKRYVHEARNMAAMIASHYEAKLCILLIVSGFHNKEAPFVLLLFFTFL